jgi:hypothetical protein
MKPVVAWDCATRGREGRVRRKARTKTSRVVGESRIDVSFSDLGSMERSFA